MLLVTAVAFRVAGVSAAVLSLAAFALTHHELPALTWAALNLLVAIALVRAMPEGRVRRLLGHWRALSLAIVAVVLVPFALSQARLAFFPQLEPFPVRAEPAPVEATIVTGAKREDAAPAAPAPGMPAAQRESLSNLTEVAVGADAVAN